ncbi:hypothetical protein [Rhodoferax sp.]|uniref:hypothetical protein n=1 Tax=Rhodoferax sp. TaxID=50421 RepID=UPI002ACF016D|nr:hypothetical protein [Rhodoferax sp.]MDZ7919668.1 hypothetical protein [Rhodoferax sp.]
MLDQFSRNIFRDTPRAFCARRAGAGIGAGEGGRQGFTTNSLRPRSAQLPTCPI